MDNSVCNIRKPVCNLGFLVLVLGSIERPVDEHRASNEVLLWHRTKVAAVEAVVAIVAQEAAHPLDEIEAGLSGRDEDDDVATVDLPVRQQRSHPFCFGGKAHAIHKQMVAYQQGVLHGG